MQMEEFEKDYESIIESCIERDVRVLCNVGYDIESTEKIKNLSVPDEIKHYAMAGIHPHYAEHIDSKMRNEIEALLSDDFYFGIGEIGLDRYWHKDEKDIEKQKEIFRMQLDIAQDAQKPVALHIRDAYEEAFDILKHYRLSNVEFHSFTGNAGQLNHIVSSGYYFGINGVVTFKNSTLKDILKEEHLNSMLLETDAPYLTPVPYRGKRNRPDYVPFIYEFLAGHFNMPINTLKNRVYDNFMRFAGNE